MTSRQRDWAHGEREPEAPLAAIWMGDFNSQPGSEEYLAITGRNPSHPNAAYLDGFVDAAVVAGAAAFAQPYACPDASGRGAEAPARLLFRRLHACRTGALGQRRYGLHRLRPFSGHDRHRSGNAGDGWRSMTLPVFLAVLAAAAMHAAWNATIKVRLDRFASISLMTVGMGVVALPALPFVALPGVRRMAADRRIRGAAYRLPAVPGQSLRDRRPRADLSAGARRSAAADHAWAASC